ncbi:MAG: hypothetical protein R3Y59_07250 [bacterium]
MAKQVKKNSSNKSRCSKSSSKRATRTTAAKKPTKQSKPKSKATRKKRIKYDTLDPKTLILYIVVGVILAVLIILPKSCNWGDKEIEDKDKIEEMTDSISIDPGATSKVTR